MTVAPPTPQDLYTLYSDIEMVVNWTKIMEGDLRNAASKVNLHDLPSLENALKVKRTGIHHRDLFVPWFRKSIDVFSQGVDFIKQDCFTWSVLEKKLDEMFVRVEDVERIMHENLRESSKLVKAVHTKIEMEDATMRIGHQQQQ